MEVAIVIGVIVALIAIRMLVGFLIDGAVDGVAGFFGRRSRAKSSADLSGSSFRQPGDPR